MLLQFVLALLERRVDNLADVMRFQLELDLARIEARHLEGLLDQAVQPVTFLVDHRQELETLGLAELRVG